MLQTQFIAFNATCQAQSQRVGNSATIGAHDKPSQVIYMTYALIPFTPALQDQIVGRIQGGETQQSIAKSIGCSPTQISRWIANNPLFAARVRNARIEATHVLMDQTIEIADTEPNAHRARNMIQARWKIAETRNRKDYGASLDMTLTERVDLGGALIEARKRSALPGCDLAQAPAIQATEYVDVTPERATDTQTAERNGPVNPFD